MRYSEGFKARIVKKAQDGSGRSVCQVSQVAAAIGGTEQQHHWSERGGLASWSLHMA